MSELNLGIFLAELRAIRDDIATQGETALNNHNSLSTKLDAVVEQQHSLDKRITTVEDTHKTVRYVGGALILGFFGMVFDMVANHLPTVRDWFRS